MILAPDASAIATGAPRSVLENKMLLAARAACAGVSSYKSEYYQNVQYLVWP